MLRKVHLHGHLAAEFGDDPFLLDVASVGEAIRALCIMKNGFKEELRKGWYKIVCRRGAVSAQLGEEHLRMSLGQMKTIHLIPVIDGGKQQGVGKVVLGVALIAGAIFFAPAAAGLLGGMGSTAFTVLGGAVTYGNIAMVGAGLLLGGAAQMLAPQVDKIDPKQQESADQRSSFMFNGPVNVSGQGHPVPVVYGRMRVGSVVASAGIATESAPLDGTSGGGSEFYE